MGFEIAEESARAGPIAMEISLNGRAGHFAAAVCVPEINSFLLAGSRRMLQGGSGHLNKTESIPLIGVFDLNATPGREREEED